MFITYNLCRCQPAAMVTCLCLSLQCRVVTCNEQVSVVADCVNWYVVMRPDDNVLQ